METELLQWSALSAVGYEKTDNATYPEKKAISNRYVIPFDDTDEEAVLLEGIMPEGFDSNYTTKLDIFGYAADDEGEVSFDVFVEASSVDDAIGMTAGESFDTANNGYASAMATAEDMMKVTVTLSNLDSAAVGDFLRIVVERNADDGSHDTAVGDFYAIGFRLYQDDAA